MTNKKTKYQHIYDALYDRLQAGHYPLGTRLPSEELLAESFQVNRLTLRRALDMLCTDGYLSVRQGSGYVVNAISPSEVNCLHSFTENVLKRGHTPSAKLVDFVLPYPSKGSLAQDVFDEDLCLIKRLRLIDNVPWILSDVYVPLPLVPDVNPSDFAPTGREQSILSILRNQFSLSWVRACEMIGIHVADTTIGALLNVEEGTPLLFQRCIAFDKNDNPVFCDYTLRENPINYDLIGTERMLQGF